MLTWRDVSCQCSACTFQIYTPAVVMARCAHLVDCYYVRLPAGGSSVSGPCAPVPSCRFDDFELAATVSKIVDGLGLRGHAMPSAGGSLSVCFVVLFTDAVHAHCAARGSQAQPHTDLDAGCDK